MGNDRNSSEDAHLIIRHKSCSYQDAIYKVMNTIANQNHPATTPSIFCIMPMVMMVTITFMMMVMTKQSYFFE